MAGPRASRAVPGVETRSDSVARFVVTVAVSVVGLFGLMRLGWVQQHLLLPFAGLQQQLAVDLFGAPPNAVVVDLSCTGADAIALCLGVIFAFPASWRARLWGGSLGLLLITVLNTLRIGTLSFAAGHPALMNLLHVYVWPALLIVAVAAYVFTWMNGDGTLRRATERGRAGVHSAGVGYRFVCFTALSVAAYFALAPSMFQSALLLEVGGWAAAFASGIILAFGGAATVSGNVLSTAHGSFVVTQECLATPLIPVYVAAALSMPLSLARRAAALLVGPLVFFCLGTSRLLVLVLPNALVGSPERAIHAFSQILAALVLVAVAAFWRRRHLDRGRGSARVAMLAIGAGAVLAMGVGPVWSNLVGGTTAALQSLVQHTEHTFGDAQGAFAMLPAFQLGLFVALWVAVSRRRAWGRLSIGVGVLALSQLFVYLAIGEFHHHVGLDPHVSLIRGWAIAFPVVMAGLLERPFRMSDPPMALEPALAGRQPPSSTQPA